MGMSVEMALMRSLFLVLLAATACTKPNPNRCCVDEADCEANNIPLGSDCDIGLLCRGNQCIAITCGASSECDATAPYCTQGACSEACDLDEECPGFGQSGTFCAQGVCVECRDANHCPTALPICDGGTCRGCITHDECPSGACSNGECVVENEVAYVDVNGSASSECTRASPCSTLDRALTVTPIREFLIVGPGTFTSASTVLPTGTRWLIGRGAATILKRSTDGPIVTIANAAIVHIDGITIDGASGNNAAGIQLGDGMGLGEQLTLNQVTVSNNSGSGLQGGGMVIATRSRFSGNGFAGVQLNNSIATFDRCEITANDVGMELDEGRYDLTNNFITRNTSDTTAVFGISLYTTTTGHRIEFNTIADNVTVGSTAGAGILCNSTVAMSFPNNIIVRNTKQTQGSNCSHPSSIIADSDVSMLKFKSSDAVPFDYHIASGSTAIDSATASTLNHDYDGEARPTGSTRDVGADEFVP